MRKLVLAPVALAAALALSGCGKSEVADNAAAAGGTLNDAGEAGTVPLDGNAIAPNEGALGNGSDDFGNAALGNDAAPLDNGG